MSKRVHAFTDDVLGYMDATDIAQAIKTKKLSVKEVAEASYNRAKKVNSELNAIVLNTKEDAMKARYSNKEGLLYGVPTYIKDNDDIKGYPTQHGTWAFKAKPAKKNGKFVDQMLYTGLNYLGKSTIPELGLICSAEDERWGITRNPWDTNRTPGGSSSGSAALVASGVVPIAQANDGAGSTRIPAALCGLVGLKPSRERLMNHGATHLLPINVVYEGVLTRSVRDTAAFYAEAEKFFYNKKMPRIGHIKEPSKKRLRIVAFNNPAPGETGHVDKETEKAYLDTVKLLEGLGHRMDFINIPIDFSKMMHYYLIYYGFLAFMQTKMSPLMFGSIIDQKQLEPFSYGLANVFQKNFMKFPKAISELKKQIHHLEDSLLENADVILMPITTIVTPEIGYLSPVYSSKVIVPRAANYSPYPGMQNISGAPAISLPMGVDSHDMPIGLQFAAGYGQEALLLSLAYELEQAQPWRMIWEE